VGGKSQENEWTLLLGAANQGDGEAYRQLLLKLTPVLRAFARRGLERAGLSGADAEDIVQETLLAIHLNKQTFHSKAQAGPWIRAIARHKMIDALRRRGRRLDIPIDDFSELLESAESEPDMLIAGVDRHLECLAPGQSKVLRAIAVDGASIGEAAARLSMTPAAVRVALHRAIRALAAKLKADDR
jgi:RNA polymerase sigma-70 factor, ECF subfamily